MNRDESSYCTRGKIERFIEPCTLLLLSEKEAHGYELIDNLEQFAIDPRCQDPGQVYRYLRRMEKEGLVESKWEAGESGPARRSYRITPDGLAVLKAWMRTLENRADIISKMLHRYKKSTT
jgi:PadR family transcriptional regulator, regulatory protein PadR